MTIDMNKYKEAFLSEAQAHVNAMNVALVELEKTPKNEKNLHVIFREAHTLKSISAAMDYQNTAKLCHSIEDILDAIRNKKISCSACVDILFSAFDFLKETLNALLAGKPELESQSIMLTINNFLKNEDVNENETDQTRAMENTQINSIEKITSIDVKVERLDRLLNLAEELLVLKMKLESLSAEIQSPELTATVDMVDRSIAELQFQVMQIRLVPIGFVFNRFIRLVRDIAKQQKKEVDLQIEGAEIELDRSLIDEISQALAHLIKNAIDHGIESSEIRLAAKKPAQGKIWLSAKRKKESLTIEVSDDGIGLDFEAIKAKAIEQHLLTSSATHEEIINALYTGLSTSKKVTAVSGRGLGIPIIKQKIESINGKIQVKSEKDNGTTFILNIPLTLAVVQVLLVKSSSRTYAIPINNIERLLTISDNDIKGVFDNEALIYNEKNILILRLSKIFGVSASPSDVNNLPTVVIRKEENALGLIVDSLYSTEEIVMKPINRMIKGSKLFSGSAVLGTGETILILDTEQLFLMSTGLNKKLENLSV